MAVVQLAQVAGTEPSILGEGLGGRLRIAIVAGEDQRSAVLTEVPDMT